MPVTVTCPCGKRLRVKDELAGKRVKCPDCGAVLPTPNSPAAKVVTLPKAPSTIASASPEQPASHAPTNQTADVAAEPPKKAQVRGRRSHKAIFFAGVGAVVLVCCFGLWYFMLKGTTGAVMADADSALRYTVRDANGVRASGNRESVLKTVGMTEPQFKAWANDPAGAAEKRAVGYALVKVGVQGQVSIRNERGSFSSRDSDSASRASKMDPVQMRDWAKDESAAGESRTATFSLSGRSEIIWRGSSGKVLYTFRNERGFCTSHDEASSEKALGMSDDQIKAWVEDESARHENRSASFAKNGFMEMISRGAMEEPPGLWR